MKLITHPINLQYLCGFTGSSGFLLLSETKNYFFTDFRYKAIAQELQNSPTRIPFEFIEMDSGLKTRLEDLTKGVKEIEFEADQLSVSELDRWKKLLPGKKWSPLKEKIQKIRAIKSEDEIQLMKASQDLNEQVLLRTQKLFKKGVMEKELAVKIKTLALELGADDISFEPIVAFGPNSAIPHHHPTERKLKENDVILIDMGMKLKGYCSDMTRTFFFGKASSEQTAVYQLVLDAQLAAIKALKAGVSCKHLDEIARKSMGEQAQFFGHSLGHGIGLEVHETPNLSSRSEDVLKENMVVTVEPGIYLEGKFGVRIEDMGRVTKEGYENFTGFGK